MVSEARNAEYQRVGIVRFGGTRLIFPTILDPLLDSFPIKLYSLSRVALLAGKGGVRDDPAGNVWPRVYCGLTAMISGYNIAGNADALAQAADCSPILGYE